jgi:hypothetical protein
VKHCIAPCCDMSEGLVMSRFKTAPFIHLWQCHQLLPYVYFYYTYNTHIAQYISESPPKELRTLTASNSATIDLELNSYLSLYTISHTATLCQRMLLRKLSSIRTVLATPLRPALPYSRCNCYTRHLTMAPSGNQQLTSSHSVRC